MGALTSNRKRGDEHLSFNHHLHPNPNPLPCIYSPDSRNPKKPRLLYATQSADQPPIVSSKSIISRIARYPESTPKLPREVHAPCRVIKFGFGKFGSVRDSLPVSRPRTVLGCGEGKESPMGNIWSNYDKAKSQAIDSLRYVAKGKEVIDLDDEPENAVATGDSSIEEVEVTVPNLHQGSKMVEPGFQPSTSSVLSELPNVNLNITGELLNSLSLDRDSDLNDLAVYKELLKSVEKKRNTKLAELHFQIELQEKILSSARSRHVKKPKVKLKKELPQEPFAPLSKEEKDEVTRALSSSNRRKVLVTHENSNIEINGQLLQCLQPSAWLNDEVINVYLELLKERENREPKKFLKCHFFNTFFYKKLIGGRTGYDYKSVRRWTTQRKLGYGLSECDKIFVPIHQDVHWCLAVINKKDKKFQYLDSLRGRDTQVLRVLAKYFVDEMKDKSGIDIDVSSWEQEYVDDLPQQKNGFDCGVFMIKYVDFYSRGLDLCFSQEHMPYFRLRTAKEILRLRAD